MSTNSDGMLVFGYDRCMGGGAFKLILTLIKGTKFQSNEPHLKFYTTTPLYQGWRGV
jgi:hypothetical protein